MLPLTQGILALLFLDPFMILMPTYGTYVILGLLLLVSAVYTTIMIKERTHDEREDVIRGRVDRTMYIASMIGIVAITSYYLITKGMVYPEIIVLLIALSVLNIGLHIYGERHW
jgi:uncharacterized membrane protein